MSIVVIDPIIESGKLIGIAVLDDGGFHLVDHHEGVEGAVCTNLRMYLHHVKDQFVYGLSQMTDEWSDHSSPDQTKERKETIRLKSVAQYAMKQTKFSGNVFDHMPRTFLERYAEARARALRSAAEKLQNSDLWNEYTQRWNFMRALHDVELNGICVDVRLVEAELRKTHSAPVSKFLRSIQGLQKNGFVTTLYNPLGGKTGRIKVESGFNSMGIPHEDPCRRTVISRFEKGSIWSFDFNAIDFRCIVKSVGGEIAEKYAGADDFHARTMQLVENSDRERVKKGTYVKIYGGSADIDDETDRRLDEIFEPVAKFRDRLWNECQRHGYIDLPHGKRLPIPDGAHPGMIVGLYAQSYSSSVFEEAFEGVHLFLKDMKSKIIIPVHDEIVIDMHPDDEDKAENIVEVMQASGFKVKSKKGKNYAEATE
jgi:hypothetical protein